MSHILDFLIDAPKSCPARSHNLAARFIVLCLRSCLVSASCTQQTCTSEQRRLIDRLVGLLTNPSTAVHELQQVCLLRTIHLLLEEGRENSEVTSGVDRNPLATQKCYCLVGLRLKAAWETLKQQGNDDKAEGQLFQSRTIGMMDIYCLLCCFNLLYSWKHSQRVLAF